MGNPRDEINKAVALAAKVQGMVTAVLATAIGRSDVVRATLLALVSGRPGFFLGPPGVNKTGTIQSLCGRIGGASFYEALMPVIASPDQLLVECTSIRERDESGGKSIEVVRRLGRAAKAHLVFADEIWKAEPLVLQALLDLSKGDGVRSDDGQMQRTPLLAFLAASNELPDPDSNLAALWSRMTIRVNVTPLDRAGKLALVKARAARQQGASSASAALTLDEINTLRAARPHVAVSDDIVEIVLGIYEQLQSDHPGEFDWLWSDDRRFGRLFDVLQAAALLAGRQAVTKADLSVLEWLLWNAPEQIPTINGVLAPLCRTPVSEAQELVDALLAAAGLV
ncbi:MAG: AAA family ATPase, partial [Candidatus Colwellbacteria bacterium]|nr:AAA family ATPase [Candidatus Colwellbacteria bacterium]